MNKSFKRRLDNLKLFFKVVETITPSTEGKIQGVRKFHSRTFIYIYTFDCLGVCNCLCVTHKRLNGWTNQAKQILGPHMTPGKMYGTLKLEKKCLEKNWNFFYHVNSKSKSVKIWKWFKMAEFKSNS